ncbi:PepSY-associated TM helix domain-containing protein [Algoriphagus pacificus]|uniref:PepSY domain-containing protein n=1 Tax=Algoriphagus pacificus TaxID=2811234 RepID=A0ABS3CK12_9BACT|nr:PepSY-associated TM helix domain-containing protein [Algoriphagus pacificus]MBN7817438.1 PepSY domain-containing protein [Algoriphagus pacificus]
MKGKRNKNILWKIHHWLGLYVGIVIAALSFTGAAAIFIPEIDQWLTRNYHQVSPKESKVPVADILVKLDSAYSDYRLLNIFPPASSYEALVFDYYKNDGANNARYHVYVDPYSGEILGTKDHYNGLANYLRQLHVRLLDNLYGRQLVGIAGIGLFIISLTGILIYGKFMKKQSFAEIRKGKGLRILMADWHKLIGITALVFNLMIAGTGAWLGLQPKIIQWFDIKAPNKFKRSEILKSAQEDIQEVFDYDHLVAKASLSIPEFIPTLVIPSSDGSNTVEVAGDIQGLPFEPHISKIIFDKTTGKEIFKYDIRDQTLGDQIYYIQEGLHFGRFGGIWLKIAYAILGLSSGILSITGYVIYLARQKNKYSKPNLALRRVSFYCLVGLMSFVVFGFISVWIGYAVATGIVTPLVYIFLFCYLSYQLYIFWHKKRTIKESVLAK